MKDKKTPDEESEERRVSSRLRTERAVRDAEDAVEASSRRLNALRSGLGLKTPRYEVVIDDGAERTPEVFDSPAIAATRALAATTAEGVTARIIEAGTNRVVCAARGGALYGAAGAGTSLPDIVEGERQRLR